MKQRVQFETTDDKYVIRLVDNDLPNYLLEKTLEPDLTDMDIGITSTGDVRLRSIKFPKTIYNEQVVRQTAERIQKRFQEEGCRSCIALAEVRSTKKTFVIPIPNDFLDQILDNVPTPPELPVPKNIENINDTME
ncbi:MAG: hypothetical protein ACYDG3_11155 [Bacillati bacterium]